MTTISASNIWKSFKIILYVIGLLWIILFISYLLPFIRDFGIKPRTVHGLIGIATAPFLHSDMNHLIANSVSLLILGSIFLAVERKLSLFILLNIIVIGGFGTWLIGRSDCGGASCSHIGASGVIYGILGYLLTMGIFTRNIKAILVSILVFFLYGGAVWGIFPTSTFMSWESHLCGFIAGIITAKFYSRRDT